MKASLSLALRALLVTLGIGGAYLATRPRPAAAAQADDPMIRPQNCG